MTMAAIGIAVGTTALSAGIGYATQPGQPQYPNEAASSAALENANVAALPTWLQEEAAAQLGKNINVPNVGSHQQTVDQQFVNIPNGAGGTTQVPYVASQWQRGGQYYQPGQPPPQVITIPKTTTVANTGTKPADFSGYGTAQIQAAQAEQAAQAQTALAQQYDPQFIAQALAEENLANPQGAAARTEENNLIQNEVANPQVNPVANQLNQQVSQQISAAANNTMTPAEEAQFSQSVASANAARGSGGSAAAYAQPIVTGASGEQRKQAAAQEGTGWLSSGATPADFAYRQQQQAMSDLSSLVNGQTPESQFKELSGAQSGPTPTSTASLSQLPNQPNAAQQAAIQSTNTQMTSALNQANPWSLGLSSALNLGSAIAKLPGTG